MGLMEEIGVGQIEEASAANAAIHIAAAGGMVFKGAFNGATAYLANDVVTSAGSTYRSKTAHTSATVPASDSTNWESIGGGGTIADGSITTEKLADACVTNGKLAEMAANTIKGNLGGEAGQPSDLSPSSARSLLGLRDYALFDLDNNTMGNEVGSTVGVRDGGISTQKLANGAVTAAKCSSEIATLTGTQTFPGAKTFNNFTSDYATVNGNVAVGVVAQSALILQRDSFITGGSTLNVFDWGIKRVAAGVVEVNNGTAGQLRDLMLRNVILSASTPASASDTGVAGTVAWDANYIYICTATNTWKRVAISTW